MKRRGCRFLGTGLVLGVVALVGCASGPRLAETLPTGSWEAEIHVAPDHDRILRFPLELRRGVPGGPWVGFVRNASETIEIPAVRFEDEELVLAFPHYDSVIRARVDESGALVGTFRRRRSFDDWQDLPFRATHVRNAPASDRRSLVELAPFLGTWSIDFAADDEPAVAIVRYTESGPWATVLTPTGDYRYLSCEVEGDFLQWSVFDGAHLFLFRAWLDDTDRLVGDFWSGDHWHETFTAVRSDRKVRNGVHTSLPDAFELSEWNEEVSLEDLVFPDLDGNPHSLAEPEYRGRVTILHLFGSWCPNCHDAAELLAELADRYPPRDVRVVGLAFELTGDFERDAAQVRRYLRRHHTRFPVLIVGPAEKEAATLAFRALKRVRAYPTTTFLDAEGTVRAIHTGFSGPATGEAYLLLRQRFEETIASLLDPPPPSPRAESSADAQPLAWPWIEPLFR
ncbi:MAG: TlpA family protein disulfide reductase [Planctomycetes bacterium]|nr:TlpA family protein disulfide reductase [Planctomycetota bacterium]